MSGEAGAPVAPDPSTVPTLITSGLIVVSVIFPILSAISVLLRWWARSHSKNQWQADDWWIVICWCITFGDSIVVWVFADLAGVNQYKVDLLTGSIRSAQALWINAMFLTSALASVKISILLFYKRIFTTPKFKMISWFTLGLMVTWWILYILLTVFQSTPIRSSWTGEGHFNMDIVAFSYTHAATSLFLDVLILTFPIPVISRLHLQRGRKIGVGFIFGLGFFCVIASVIRLVFVTQVQEKVTQSNGSGYDAIYIYTKSFMFAIIEPHCSIIAACLPCYGPLLRGRAPESIINSVRSVLSLRSRQSSGSGSNRSGQSRPGNNTKGTESAVKLTEVGGSQKPSVDENPGWEWHPSGENTARVERSQHAAPNGNGAIAVTKTYSTTENV